MKSTIAPPLSSATSAAKLLLHHVIRRKSKKFATEPTESYATFSDVVDYLSWLGAHFTDSHDLRGRIEAAGDAMKAQEAALVKAMISGTGNQKGLAELEGVTIIGGEDNPAREGLVCLSVSGVASADVVHQLNYRGIRTHVRKADHYSGNILRPLGFGCACVAGPL